MSIPVYPQSNQIFKLPDLPNGTVTYNVSENETGKLLLLPAQTGGAGITLHLPAAKPGMYFKIMTTGTTGQIVTITPTGATVTGLFINNNAAAVAAVTKNGAASFNFTDAATIGTWVEMVCGGSVWYVSGNSGVVGFA